MGVRCQVNSLQRPKLSLYSLISLISYRRSDRKFKATMGTEIVSQGQWLTSPPEALGVVTAS